MCTISTSNLYIFIFNCHQTAVCVDHDNLERLFIDLDNYIRRMINYFQDDGACGRDSDGNKHVDNIDVTQEVPQGIGVNGLIRKYHFKKKRAVQDDSMRNEEVKMMIGHITINVVNVGWVLDCISNYQILSTADTKYTDEFRR